MTTDKPHYFKMPHMATLQLVKNFCIAGNPPLGYNFGLIQPNLNDTIIVGSCYGIASFNYTIRALLTKSVYTGHGQFKDELATNLETAKQIIRLARDHNYHLDDTVDLSGLVETEVFRSFSTLSITEQAFYRLAILLINTMTEGHNWACEYMEYLAETYVKNNDEWQLIENDTWKDDILDICLNSDLKDQLTISAYNKEVHYPACNPEIYSWLEELDETLDISDYITGFSIRWDKDEFLRILAWVVEWIQEIYSKGDLELTLTHEIEGKELRDFLTMVDKQMTLF